MKLSIPIKLQKSHTDDAVSILPENAIILELSCTYLESLRKWLDNNSMGDIDIIMYSIPSLSIFNIPPELYYRKVDNENLAFYILKYGSIENAFLTCS
jgi:hypothetical protein